VKIRKLSSDEIVALNDGLALAGKLLNKRLPLSVSDVQNLYDYFVSSGSEFQEGSIGLGLSFGQLIVDSGKFEWVRVEDKYGEETVVSPIGSMTICAPISIIQKRIERKEDINIESLKIGII